MRDRYGGWAAALRRRAEKGLRSATYRQWGRRCFRSLGGTARSFGQLLLGVLDLGVGTRGTRIGATPMHIRARARRRGRGRLASSSSSSWSSFPRMREMSTPPKLFGSGVVRAALCEHRRRGARGGVRGDLGRWCCNAWAGGECLISSKGSPPFGGSICLLSFCLCAYERDSRVSLTPR